MKFGKTEAFYLTVHWKSPDELVRRGACGATVVANLTSAAMQKGSIIIAKTLKRQANHQNNFSLSFLQHTHAKAKMEKKKFIIRQLIFFFPTAALSKQNLNSRSVHSSRNRLFSCFSNVRNNVTIISSD